MSFWERHLSFWNCPLPINRKEQKSGLSFALFFIHTVTVPTGKPTAVLYLLAARWRPCFYLPHWHEDLAVGLLLTQFPAEEMAERGSWSNSKSLLLGRAQHPEVTTSLPSGFSAGSY